MNKYFSFDGLTARSEYWATTIIILVGSVVSGFIGGFFGGVGSSLESSGLVAFGLISMFIGLIACFWASLAVTARRCRDAGITPWWALTLLLPYISIIAIIVFGCIATEEK